MSLKTLENVARQAENTARNAVGNATASVRRETSITAWANRLLAAGAQKHTAIRKVKDEGVYILSPEDVQKGRQMDAGNFVAPDGYVRRSPVQAIVVDPGYRRRLIRQGILWILVAGLAVLTLYVLTQYGITSF